MSYLIHLNGRKSFFSGSEVDCRKGDGEGGTEIELSGQYTVQECVTAVKKHHPRANGASMDFNCPNKCSCWAEFDMDRWEGTSYQACYLKKKGEYSIPLRLILLNLWYSKSNF